MEINALLQAVQTELPEDEKNLLFAKLQDHIAYLIAHNMERLLQLLYTLDVPEQALKNGLAQQPQSSAAAVITTLIIQRQQQKWATRQLFQNPMPADGEEELW